MWRANSQRFGDLAPETRARRGGARGATFVEEPRSPQPSSSIEVLAVWLGTVKATKAPARGGVPKSKASDRSGSWRDLVERQVHDVRWEVGVDDGSNEAGNPLGLSSIRGRSAAGIPRVGRVGGRKSSSENSGPPSGCGRTLDSDQNVLLGRSDR